MCFFLWCINIQKENGNFRILISSKNNSYNFALVQLLQELSKFHTYLNRDTALLITTIKKTTCHILDHQYLFLVTYYSKSSLYIVDVKIMKSVNCLWNCISAVNSFGIHFKTIDNTYIYLTKYRRYFKDKIVSCKINHILKMFKTCDKITRKHALC